MLEKIDIFKVLDYIRDHAALYAEAKAKRIYMDEFRKTLKSELFFEALEYDAKTIAEREAYAYANQRYKEHLSALKQAVQEEEHLRWMLIAAQAKAEAWRSLEASNRALDKSAQ